eukprot:Ihof_evm5s144 gene=Ihof_evmTU5s144
MVLRERIRPKVNELELEADLLLAEIQGIKDVPNQLKRVYHAKLGLLRLDIDDYLNTLKEDPTTDEEREALAAVDKKLEATGVTLGLKQKRINGPLALLRFIGLLVYVFFISMPLLWLVLPLRLLHPFLRTLGVSNNNLPVDMSMKLFAKGFVVVCGITMTAEVDDGIDFDNNYVCMFTHASNIDPWITQATCPIGFKWIGKKEIFSIPIFGWLVAAQGHIGLDRSNRDKCIKSLDKAVTFIHTYKRSIAISPEGTRARNGLLAPFKKGPFHTIKKVNLPILPVQILNAFERWPPGQWLPTPGHVVIRYLPPVSFPKGTTPQSMINPVRRAFLEDL